MSWIKNKTVVAIGVAAVLLVSAAGCHYQKRDRSGYWDRRDHDRRYDRDYPYRDRYRPYDRYRW